VTRKKKAAGFPSLQGFCAELGIHRETLFSWAALYPKFAVAIKEAKEIQERLLVKHAMSGQYNTAFAIFFAKNNMGWKDKVEQEVIQKEPIKIEIVDHDSDAS
jgi:DNA-packaging protein gp3